MGNFCTKCGRPLQPGEICNCQGTAQQIPVNAAAGQTQEVVQIPQQSNPQNQGQYQQVPPQGQYQQIPPQGQPYQQAQGQFQQGPQGYYQQGQTNPQMAAASQYAKSFAQNLLGLLKNPVTTGRQLAQVADIKVSMIYFVLEGFFSALFGTIAAVALYREQGLNEAYHIPGFRIFVITLLASFVLNLILAGLLWLGHLILGQQTTYQRMLSAVSVRSALTVPTTVIALVLFAISKPFGIVFFFAASIWGFVAMIMVVDSGIGEPKKDISALVIAVVLLIFLAVFYFAMTRLGQYYLPDEVREEYKNLMNLFGSISSYY